MALRLLRWLLRLYPEPYRRRYGAEMEAFVREQQARGAGGPRLWLGLVVDHAVASWAVRRQSRGEGGMSRIGADLGFALRVLRRTPAFTTFALITLAFGIGATAAVFSVLDRVVLRPLPYPDAAHLVLVGGRTRFAPEARGPLSPALMVALQDDPGPAEAVVASGGLRTVLRSDGDPERVEVTRVTEGFFPFFGAEAGSGRLFDPADHAPGAPDVVVLGHAYWKERFAEAPVVGRTLTLDDRVHTVVGVLARGFIAPPEMVEHDDLWVPLRLREGEPVRGSFFLVGAARLPVDAEPARMQAHMESVVARVYPPGDGPNFLEGGAARDFHAEVVGDVGSALGRVLAAVGLLLLIACVNVASLLLTRGTERGHELAVRAALGAGRGRLIRQLMGESVWLALGGGLLGSALAYGAVAVFRARAPEGLPRLAEVGVDERGLAFAVALGLSTVLAFGVLPAVRAVGSSRGGAELGGTRTTAPRGDGRLRAGLIALETALAVMLAVGSALFAHDLTRMARTDPGFVAGGVATLRLDLAPRYGREEWAGVWQRLLDGARGLPGVTSAAVASQVPFTGDRMASTYRPEPAAGDAPLEDGEFAITVIVGGDYLPTLSGRLVEGRTFAERGEPVPGVLINEAYARQHWPGETAVGKRIQSGGAGVEDEPTYQVVGVVGDMRTRPGRDIEPRVFLDYRESAWRDVEIVVRTQGEAAALAPALRALVRQIDPDLPITSVRTLEGLGHEALARPRFYTVLFGSFALVALFLAVVGVYGTTAYATRTRTREIGIRLALGAERPRIVRTIVGHAVAVVSAGIGVGLLTSALGAGLLDDVLYHVGPRDLLAYAAVAALVLGAGLLAAWIPAGRASRVDPTIALREEG